MLQESQFSKSFKIQMKSSFKLLKHFANKKTSDYSAQLFYLAIVSN